MNRPTPAVRHNRRMLAWLVLSLIALAVVVTIAYGVTPSVDGRHIFLVGAVFGLVMESEWKP